jgi:hypothetical protein
MEAFNCPPENNSYPFGFVSYPLIWYNGTIAFAKPFWERVTVSPFLLTTPPEIISCISFLSMNYCFFGSDNLFEPACRRLRNNLVR